MFAAHLLLSNQSINIVLTTFGSPRVGDIQFAKFMSVIESYRVTHNRDLIVHLPPAIGYRHINSEYWYSWNGVEQCISDYITSTTEGIGCANSVFAIPTVMEHRCYLGLDITNCIIEDHDTCTQYATLSKYSEQNNHLS